MRQPGIYTLRALVSLADGGVMASIDGKTWVPARPEAGFGILERLRAAWLVFTGRADAVVWPGQ